MALACCKYLPGFLSRCCFAWREWMNPAKLESGRKRLWNLIYQPHACTNFGELPLLCWQPSPNSGVVQARSVAFVGLGDNKRLNAKLQIEQSAQTQCLRGMGLSIRLVSLGEDHSE